MASSTPRAAAATHGASPAATAASAAGATGTTAGAVVTGTAPGVVPPSVAAAAAGGAGAGAGAGASAARTSPAAAGGPKPKGGKKASSTARSPSAGGAAGDGGSGTGTAPSPAAGGAGASGGDAVAAGGAASGPIVRSPIFQYSAISSIPVTKADIVKTDFFKAAKAAFEKGEATFSTTGVRRRHIRTETMDVDVAEVTIELPRSTREFPLCVDVATVTRSIARALGIASKPQARWSSRSHADHFQAPRHISCTRMC